MPRVYNNGNYIRTTPKVESDDSRYTPTRIQYNRGERIPGTDICVFYRRKLWTASRDGIPVAGYYDSKIAAVTAAKHLTYREILEVFGLQIAPGLRTRPITYLDLHRYLTQGRQYLDSDS